MRKKKSPILEAVHETAKGFFEAGGIDKVTMQEYDRLCLRAIESSEPEDIKQVNKTTS